MDLRVTLRMVPEPSSQQSIYIAVAGRYIEGVGSYAATVTRTSAGKVQLSLDGSGAIGRLAGPSLAIDGGAAGETGTPIVVRMQVEGFAPTRLRVKAWLVDSPEPDWLLVASNGAPAMQALGYPGFSPSASGTALPATFYIDDFEVRGTRF